MGDTSGLSPIISVLNPFVSLHCVALALWLAAVPAAVLAGARGLEAWVAAFAALFAVMAARKRSPRLALHSLLTWTVIAAGLVIGFVRGGAPLPPDAGSEPAC